MIRFALNTIFRYRKSNSKMSDCGASFPRRFFSFHLLVSDPKVEAGPSTEENGTCRVSLRDEQQPILKARSAIDHPNKDWATYKLFLSKKLGLLEMFVHNKRPFFLNGDKVLIVKTLMLF